LGRRQRCYGRSEIEIIAERVQQPLTCRCLAAPRDGAGAAPRVAASQGKVVECAECWNKSEILVHEAKAGSERRVWISEPQRFAVYRGDGSCIWLVVSSHDLDERRLPGPIRPHQC